MKKTIDVKHFYLSALFAAGVGVIVFSRQVKQGVSAGLTLCAETLIPSLFLFLLFCNLACCYLPQRSGVLSELFASVFRLPPCAAPVFLLSLIGGYPTGAMMCAAVFEQGLLSRRDAQHLSLLCCCSGPAFCILSVGEGMCADKMLGVILFGCNVLAQVSIGVFLRRLGDKNDKSKADLLYAKQLPFSDALHRSVDNSIHAMTRICAYVIVCSAVIRVLELLPLPKTGLHVCCALLEVTTGCRLFYSNPCALAFFLGFGGLSIFFQLKHYLDVLGTKAWQFLSCRIVGGILSAALCRCALFVYSPAVPTLAGGMQVQAFSYSAPLSAALVLCFSVFVLEEKRNLRV